MWPNNGRNRAARRRSPAPATDGATESSQETTPRPPADRPFDDAARPGMSPRETCLRFDRFTLDLRRATLHDGEAEAHLRRKTFDVLAYLVQHAGRVVSKQELSEAVWGDVAVTDDSLVQCLVEIRRVLGDRQEFVRTKRGRGYLFDAPVSGLASASMLHGAADGVANEAPDIVPAVVVDVRGIPDDARPSPVSFARDAAAAAVDAGADQAAEPGAWRDAMSEVSRRHRHPAWPAHRFTVVGGILLGSVGAGAIAWTALRSRDVQKAAPASASVVAVADRAPHTMTRRAGARPVEAQRAYDAGMAGVRRVTRVGLGDAIHHLESAAALAPDDPQIQAGLSDALTLSSVFGLGRPVDLLPRAKAAALRAVALDPTLAEAHVSLAHAYAQADWDWAGAEASYRRAIALHPNLQRAHTLYAHLLMAVARFDEAERESARARELASSLGLPHASSGIVAYISRQPARARQHLRRALEIQPTFSLAHFWLALTEANRGRLDEAMVAALASRDDVGNAPTPVVGYIHGLAGRRGEAIEVLRALEARATSSYVPATDFALVHMGLGDRDAALRWLERGVEEHARWMELAAVHPAWDPLRHDPRFIALVRRLKLPANAVPGASGAASPTASR